MAAATNSASEDVGKVPIIEVAFKNGMWWALPQEMSQGLYDKYRAGGEDIGYTWDWGTERSGSWKLGDEETSINRYLLDFEAGIVCVDPSTTTPPWTGQIPNKRKHTDP